MLRSVVITAIVGSIGLALSPQSALLAQDATQTEVDSLRAQIERLEARLETLESEPDRDDDEAARLRAAAEAAVAEAGAPDTLDTGDDRDFVGRQRSLQALNPEISVTADLLAAVDSEDPDADNFVAREFEFSFQSTLDPYSRAKIFITRETPGAEIEPFPEPDEAEEEAEFEVEEGYIEWVNLPGGMGLKAGRFFQQFGTLNRWHQHALPFQSRSLPHIALIGEEALAQTGVSLRWLAPTSGAGGAYEATFELNRSSNDALFGESSGLSYLGHLNGFWQLNDALDLDLGLSVLFGDHEVEDASFDQRLYGVEGALTWAPPGRARYRGLVVRGGAMLRDPGDVPESIEAHQAVGAWIAGEARLGQSWLLGARYDWVENPDDPEKSTWVAGPTLTWWQSEWVRIRAELDVLGRPNTTDGLFVIQATAAMGPHKHETY